uniref:Uncharacterized protein n=1 Tax=viral metagenome TaxID=1070528 RepID=A0A6M3LBI0_9ZZZZ
MLVERPVTQFPDAPKGLISIDDSMWLQALKAVLASDLEPRQKSDLADKLIGQQFESKSGFWKGLFETSIKLISLAAGIFTAIKVAS